MKAILSDIHSNLEALQAVLQDIAQHGVTEIYCLGDVVGYGPNPRECLDLAMPFHLTLLGNHDQAVFFDPGDFNPVAERATYWTRYQLEAPIRNRQEADRRWEFLAERPTLHQEGDLLFVHGSPRNPIKEYIFPDDVYRSPRKLERIFALVPRYCFHGHTHVPGIITENLEYLSPEEIDYVYTLNGKKTLVNVGSVGQPRDGDWRACYVLLDGDRVIFRRLEYDVETTVRKMQDIPELDPFLAERLRQGR
jgi:diadenosine tetraphosphatase ApaH/serine/threonine PP2A family protein phosphatase